MSKIKIISGYSHTGGSTIAFINLTNELNKLGYDTTFYGPHQWHLDKCKSSLLNGKLNLEKGDKLIFHFLSLPDRPNADKVILSCHEKNLFEVGKIKKYWDTAVFLNETQKKYHSDYNGEFLIIPNLRERLINSGKKEEVKLVAGIIGSIDENKQTHISINRAINFGYTKIILFGDINDQIYFNRFVKPLLNDNIIIYGFENNKQKMYDMVGAVFLSSKSEVASLVKDECITTGTKFYGNDATNNDIKELTNDEIIKEWIKILEL